MLLLHVIMCIILKQRTSAMKSYEGKKKKKDITELGFVVFCFVVIFFSHEKLL